MQIKVAMLNEERCVYTGLDGSQCVLIPHTGTAHAFAGVFTEWDKPQRGRGRPPGAKNKPKPLKVTTEQLKAMGQLIVDHLSQKLGEIHTTILSIEERLRG